MFVRNCPTCNRELTYKGEQAFLRAEQRKQECRSCFTTRNNPFRGKHFSIESKAKLSASKRGKKASLETRAKMSLARKGEGNSFFGKTHTEEARRKIALNSQRFTGENNPFFGKHHTAETCQRMSESRARGIADGTIPNTNGYGRKGWYTSSKSSESFFYDSMLEKFYMQRLDSDVTVVTWTKRHGIRIPYTNCDGVPKMFVPDFLVTRDRASIEEVKGRDKNAEFKRFALHKFAETKQMSYRWVTQGELEVLGYRSWIRNEQ